MKPTSYEVKCLSCSAEIGLIVGTRFLHDPRCRMTPPRQGGRLRCCRCGGRLFLEPVIDSAPLPVDWVRLAQEAASEVA